MKFGRRGEAPPAETETKNFLNLFARPPFGRVRLKIKKFENYQNLDIINIASQRFKTSTLREK